MNTKYDIGQKICFIEDNKLKIERILNISIYSDSVVYTTENFKCAETNAYDTPQEAIESLLNYSYDVDPDTDVNTNSKKEKTQMILE